MEFSWEKWLVMGLLAVVSFVLGLIPYVVLGRDVSTHHLTSSSQSLHYRIILTILSTFGGGVLLATSIVHMLSEAREEFEHIPEIWNTLETDFPLAEIITLIGFLLIYLVEEVAHVVIAHEEHGDVARHNSIAHSISLPDRKMSILTASDANQCELTTTQSTFEDESISKKGVGSALRSFLALTALSFHAIMEGIAIGVQDSTDVWFMFGAVASHKFVISFCMGMELVAARVRLRTVITSILFFAIVSPIGILIGTLVSEGDTNTLPIAVIKGLSTGTLMYVVFFEILNRERERKATGDFMGASRVIGFLQMISLTLGMTAMTVLVVTAKHSHDHETDDDGVTETHRTPTASSNQFRPFLLV